MILEVDGVVKRFGGLVALNNVSLAVEQGEIFGLIGPNGAGKSTLLNVVAGVYRPDQGRVQFEGTAIGGWPPQRICKQGIARTFQISRPFPKMTVMDNVLVAATFGHAHPVHDPHALAAEKLAFVEFPLPGDTLTASLNAGQLRRLDLARALASQPRLLLLDEVAAGLRTSELADIQRIICKIRDSGVTILIVEHLMQLIMQLCGRIAVLHYGSKIAEGTPAEIAANKHVQEAYLGEEHVL